jgi:p-aminobenzoyl-glutamate transporter AbgT
LALLEWEVRDIKFRIVKFGRLTAAVAFAGSGVGWHSQWSILILSLVPHTKYIHRYLRRHPFHGIMASIANLTCLLGSTEVQSSRHLDDAHSISSKPALGSEERTAQ